MADFKFINVDNMTVNLIDELTTANSTLVEYIIDNEPEDKSPNADNVVMKKQTIGKPNITKNTLVCEVLIDVPYADRRNWENKLNPHKKGYIQKGMDKAIQLMEDLDYAQGLE